MTAEEEVGALVTAPAGRAALWELCRGKEDGGVHSQGAARGLRAAVLGRTH